MKLRAIVRHRKSDGIDGTNTMMKGITYMKKNLVAWLRKNRVQVLVWIGFILYETVAVGILFDIFADPIIYIVHYAIIILLFYLNAHWALPYALSKRIKLISVPLVVTSQLLIYVLLHFSADKLMIHAGFIENKGPYTLNSSVINRNLYRGLFFMGFSTGYYYLRRFLFERRKTELLDRQRLEGLIAVQTVTQELSDAENSFLKAQINPHFLFNTLHMIYHRAEKHSPEVAEGILRLSKIMRFAIDSSNGTRIPKLKTEIDHVSSLLYLNQFNSDRQQFISFDYPAEIFDLKFLPLILLTLVENVFKHGELYNPEKQAIISIEIKEGNLLVLTRNFSRQIVLTSHNGIGLQNITKRLSLAFGNDFIFDYGLFNDGYFQVLLKVPLSNLES